MKRSSVFQYMVAVWCCVYQYVTAQTNWGYVTSDPYTNPTNPSHNDIVSSSHNTWRHYDNMYQSGDLNPAPTSSRDSHTDWPNYDWYTNPAESSSYIAISSSMTSFVSSAVVSIPISESTTPYSDYDTTDQVYRNATPRFDADVNASASFSNTMGVNESTRINYEAALNSSISNVITPFSHSAFTSTRVVIATSSAAYIEYSQSPLNMYSEAITSSNILNESVSFHNVTRPSEIINSTESNDTDNTTESDTIILPSISYSVQVSVSSMTPTLSSSIDVTTAREMENSTFIRTDRLFNHTDQTIPLVSEINVTSVAEMSKTVEDVINITPKILLEVQATQLVNESSDTVKTTLISTLDSTTPYPESNKSRVIADITTNATLNSTTERTTITSDRTINSTIDSTFSSLQTSFFSSELGEETHTEQTTATFTLISSRRVISTADIQTGSIISSTETENLHSNTTIIVLSETSRSSSTIYVAPSSSESTPTIESISPSSTFISDISTRISYTTETPEPTNDYRILINFKDTCGKMKGNRLLKIEFIEALVDIIQNVIPNMNDTDFELEQFICDPFTVVLLLKNIKEQACIVKLLSVVKNISVPIIDNTIIRYQATGVKLLTVTNTTGDGGDMSTRALDTSDIVVIVISALLFAFLLLLGGIAICREFYKRKRAASFNLLDVPPVNVKLDDFTLTRIPRPQMTYFESNPNPIVTNGRHKIGKDSNEPNGKTDNKIKVNSENIHVRMRDHSDGLVIGVTCSPLNYDGSSPTSGASSPTTPSMDQAEQSLIMTSRKSDVGTTNPNCYVDDEYSGHSKAIVKDDGKEEFL